MKWKNYDLDFCDLCERVYFICTRCGDNSCSMRGCNLCQSDWKEFSETKWYQITNRANFENEVFNL